jgi:hypothetical protein
VGLDDADASVRDQSRDALMRLTRAELPALRDVAAEFKPLPPMVRDVLKDVVTHVWLTESTYKKEAHGFLGILMPPQFGEGAPGAARTAVVIDDRMPGFVGYGALRNGDVIVDIVERPLPQPLDRSIFINVVRGMDAGDTITLKILRDGKVAKVPVTLDARPAQDPRQGPLDYEMAVRQLNNDRVKEADRYWSETFDPALAELAGKRER